MTGDDYLKDSVFLIGGRQEAPMMNIYSIFHDQWRDSSPPKNCRPFLMNAIRIPTSNKIYVFGGDDNDRSWERYDVATDTWDLMEKITSGDKAHQMISTCYDGARYIYLVGGFELKVMKRGPVQFKEVANIDRFDTQDHTFETIGKLNQPVVAVHSFYHNNAIHVVAGEIKSGKFSRSIISFDPVTLEETTLVDNILSDHKGKSTSQVNAACFDGVDTLYYITDDWYFYQLSIETKVIKPLSKLPFDGKQTGFRSIAYKRYPTLENPEAFRIYHFRRKNYHWYSSIQNKWYTTLPIPFPKDGDPAIF
eukprot:gene13285-15616_t